MTKENGYRKMRAKYQRMVDDANKTYMFSGHKRDRERLEYLQGRLNRYTI